MGVLTTRRDPCAGWWEAFTPSACSSLSSESQPSSSIRGHNVFQALSTAAACSRSNVLVIVCIGLAVLTRITSILEGRLPAVVCIATNCHNIIDHVAAAIQHITIPEYSQNKTREQTLHACCTLAMGANCGRFIQACKHLRTIQFRAGTRFGGRTCELFLSCRARCPWRHVIMWCFL